MPQNLKANDIGISLFAYDRPDHLSQCLFSLREQGADNLFIFCDGPKSEAPSDQLQRIQEVRNIVNSFEIENKFIICQDSNLGLRNHWKFGWNYVFERHSKLISIEDDCVIRSGFFEYMKACLHHYEHDDRVMSCTAHTPLLPVPENYNYDAFFCNRVGVWGQGIWKRSWAFYEENFQENIQSIRSNREKRKLLDSAGEDLFYMMESSYRDKAESIAVWWAWSILKNGGVCVYPTESFIDNMGFDGSGTNCGKSDKYRSGFVSNAKMEKYLFPTSIDLDTEMNLRYMNIVRPKRITKIYRKLEFLFSGFRERTSL